MTTTERLVSMDEVFDRAGLRVARRRGEQSGRARYFESFPFSPDGRFWATETPRFHCLSFGVQFESLAGSAEFAGSLVAAGYEKRGVSDREQIYAKRIPHLPDGSPDIAAVRAAKAELEALFAAAPPHRRRENLVAFVRRTLPATAELEAPPRVADLEPEDAA
jgi:hypothetical protein